MEESFVQLGKGGNILGEKDWIMKKEFVALITEKLGLTFLAPWARFEDSFLERPFAIGRPTKKTFGHKMVARTVAAPIQR